MAIKRYTNGKNIIEVIDGEQGPKGDTGAMGPMGPQGILGIQGLEGPRGHDGAMGLQGDTGDKGEKGDKGDVGLSGNDGATGPIGLIGEKGDKGDRGDPGRHGVNGRDGKDGKDGKEGKEGKMGPQGLTGPAGMSGGGGGGTTIDLQLLPAKTTPVDADLVLISDSESVPQWQKKSITFKQVTDQAVPAGGLEHQVLSKKSDADYDVGWASDTTGLTAVVEDLTPELGGDLDCLTHTITNASKVQIKQPDAPVIGANLVTGNDSTFSGPGNWTVNATWTVHDGAYYHTVGLGQTSLPTVVPEIGKWYRLVIYLTTTVGGIASATFGGVTYSDVYAPADGRNVLVASKAIGTGVLTLIPSEDWVGSIDNVSICEITPSTAAEIINAKTETNTPIEFRTDVNGCMGVGFNALQFGGGIDNTAVGCSALDRITGGSSNTAVGFRSLQHISNNNDNTAIGSNSAEYLTTGHQNTALGSFALRYNLSGGDNTAVGVYALRGGTLGTGSGSRNVGVGSQALMGMQTGIENIAIGSYAGQNIVTGNYNTLLGHGAGSIGQTYSNSIFIGWNAGGVCTEASSLIIDSYARTSNADTIAQALIYGTHAALPANQQLTINGLLSVNFDRLNIKTSKTPSSATDTGVAGTICWDTNYHYKCVATNDWRRVPLQTWDQAYAEVTGSTQACTANGYYGANYSTLLTFTLPTTAAVGTSIRIIGIGNGGWKVAQNASQYIRITTGVSSTGIGGYIASTNQYDTIELTCIVANVGWTATKVTGAITVV